MFVKCQVFKEPDFAIAKALVAVLEKSNTWRKNDKLEIVINLRLTEVFGVMLFMHVL